MFLRLFAVSDIHTDYQENKNWISSLSNSDYKNDILILAGDISSNIRLLTQTLRILKSKFMQVLFIPGNHDLWIEGNLNINSLEKFDLIQKITDEFGVITEVFEYQNEIRIIPLLGWYDYSFGEPSNQLNNCWMDYFRCKWPENFNEKQITNYFISKNTYTPSLSLREKKIVTFSHFLPRIDLMPFYIPHSKRFIYPVLGTNILEKQIREINPIIHIYGHSHVNLSVKKNKIQYINNAFGYPNESHITAKELRCIMEI